MKKENAIAIIIFGVATILCFFPGLNIWIALVLYLLGVFLLGGAKPVKTINDAKLLWIYAQSTPAGIHDLPDFDEINPLFRGWQWEKNFCFCIYVYRQRRFGIILDSVLSPDHKVIHFKQAVSNKVSLSQIRDIAIKAAYGRNDRFTIETLQKRVEALGGRIIWGKSSIVRPQTEMGEPQVASDE